MTTQQEYLLAIKGYTQIQNSPIPEAITQAKSLVEASRERLRLWGLTDAQIENISKAGQPQTTMTITAPISGVVIHKTVRSETELGFRIQDSLASLYPCL